MRLRKYETHPLYDGLADLTTEELRQLVGRDFWYAKNANGSRKHIYDATRYQMIVEIIKLRTGEKQ